MEAVCCSCAAVDISEIEKVVLLTPSTIFLNACAASFDTSLPWVIRLTDSLISFDISLVAWDERSASFLTSSATTEKPKPCSPARAASIAALKASRLVWLAISLITLTIWHGSNNPCFSEH
nr:hypothetical protein [Legionella sp. km772]